MSDRLQELRRQRALLQQHVAWLDQEIARQSGPAPAPSPVAAPAPAAVAPTSTAQPLADDILGRYEREKPGNMALDARRGCILYFIFGMGSLILFALGAYLVYQQTH